MLPLSSKAIWVPTFFFLRCSKLRRKSRQQKDKSNPLSPCSTGGMSRQAPRTPWLRQNHFHLQKAGLDVMLAPLWLCCSDGAEPNTPRWTLQAAAQREPFLLPQPNAPSGAPSRDRLESLVWTLAQAQRCSSSLCHLEAFPPIIHWSWLFCYNKLPNSTP